MTPTTAQSLILALQVCPRTNTRVRITVVLLLCHLLYLRLKINPFSLLFISSICFQERLTLVPFPGNFALKSTYGLTLLSVPG